MRRHIGRVTRCAGVSFIEMIVAVLLLGTALLGMIALWTVALSFTVDSSDTGVAYNLGRHAMERLKEKGFYYLRDDQDTETRYYKETDTGVTQLSSSQGADFRVRQRVRTGNLTGSSDSTFVASSVDGEGDLRRLHVTVYDQSTGAVLFDSVSYLAKGGR
ncbi:MAG: hypothetical protein NZT92_01655 [Abditibacteriales bacterium]|nr:hypothetical protein [Abditibacteriales bacterium]MDW8364974.1 hypothetical protein [Abditibacteriales bacterium]